VVYITDGSPVTWGLDTTTGNTIYSSGGPFNLTLFAPWNILYAYAQDVLACTADVASCAHFGSPGEDVPTIAGSNIAIVYGANTGTLRGVTQQGSPLWTKSEHYNHLFSDASGVVFAISQDTTDIVAINDTTGAELWRQHFPTTVSTLLLGDDGTLYLNVGSALYKSAAPPAQTGTIIITSNRPDATFTLSPAIPGFPTSGPFPVTRTVPLNTYTVTFKQIAGFNTTPLPAQTLTAGNTIIFTGTYTPVVQPGTIVVTSTPSGAGFHLAGPGNTTYDAATPFNTSTAPPGDYTITWTLLNGYASPTNAFHFTLASGGSIAFIGHYTALPTTASITVLSTPPGAGFNITGPGLTFYSGVTRFSIPQAPPGDYKITWSILLGGYSTPASQTFHLDAGDVLTLLGTYDIFRCKQDVILKVVDNGHKMAAMFTPPSGLLLGDLAAICGFTGFDWQQVITVLPSPGPLAAASNPTIRLTAPPAFLDPAPGGYILADGSKRSDTSYPFYYNTNGEVQSKVRDNTLFFGDTPSDNCLPGGSGESCGGRTAVPGSYIEFTTSLVGILPGNIPSPPLVSWTWRDTFNGTSGGISILKNDLPVDPGSGTGGITITSINGIDPSAEAQPLDLLLWFFFS
jgi:hypothetical protein